MQPETCNLYLNTVFTSLAHNLFNRLEGTGATVPGAHRGCKAALFLVPYHTDSVSRTAAPRSTPDRPVQVP